MKQIKTKPDSHVHSYVKTGEISRCKICGRATKQKEWHDPITDNLDPKWKANSFNNYNEAHLICRDCAKRQGRKLKGLATFYEDVCDVCGDTKVVTELRDYTASMVDNTQLVEKHFNPTQAECDQILRKEEDGETLVSATINESFTWFWKATKKTAWNILFLIGLLMFIYGVVTYIYILIYCVD